MIHLYKARTYENRTWGQPNVAPKFKRFCDGEWIQSDEHSRGHNGMHIPRYFTSVHHRVTCPKCLDILIPKKQAELNQMLKARATVRTIDAPSPAEQSENGTN